MVTSLAHGIPCVMTPVAAEGVAFPEALRWLVAETPAAMAEKLVALHRDDAFAESLGEACLAFIREEFGEEAVLRRLAEATGPVAGG